MLNFFSKLQPAVQRPTTEDFIDRLSMLDLKSATSARGCARSTSPT
jgi:hypothetical protein